MNDSIIFPPRRASWETSEPSFAGRDVRRPPGDSRWLSTFRAGDPSSIGQVYSSVFWVFNYSVNPTAWELNESLPPDDWKHTQSRGSFRLAIVQARTLKQAVFGQFLEKGRPQERLFRRGRCFAWWLLCRLPSACPQRLGSCTGIGVHRWNGLGDWGYISPVFDTHKIVS